MISPRSNTSTRSKPAAGSDCPAQAPKDVLAVGFSLCKASHSPSGCLGNGQRKDFRRQADSSQRGRRRSSETFAERIQSFAGTELAGLKYPYGLNSTCRLFDFGSGNSGSWNSGRGSAYEPAARLLNEGGRNILSWTRARHAAKSFRGTLIIGYLNPSIAPGPSLRLETDDHRESNFSA